MLLRQFAGSGFTNDRHLDLSGVCKLSFNLILDITSQLMASQIIHLLRHRHYANLASCLNSIGAVYPIEGLRDFLKLLQTIDVIRCV